MADEHIGTREEAIARLRAEQEAHAKTRQELAKTRAERDAATETARMYWGNLTVLNEAVDRVASERDAALRLANERPAIQPQEAECIVSWMEAAILDGIDDAVDPPPWVYRVRDALRAHADGSSAAEASETTDEMIARHNKVNARLLAEAIEDSAWDEDETRQTDAPTCVYCGKPAACLGRYEGQPEGTFACDECCGHGNEDGRCKPIDPVEVKRDVDALMSKIGMKDRGTYDPSYVFGSVADPVIGPMCPRCGIELASDDVECCEKPDTAQNVAAAMTDEGGGT